MCVCVYTYKSARSRVSHWLLRRFFFLFFSFFFFFPSLYTTAAFSRAHRRVRGMHVLVHIRSNPPGSPFRISPLVLSRRPATVSFERVTVVSRATASPTRAGTHTRTCVQRGISAIVCEHPFSSSPRPPRARFTKAFLRPREGGLMLAHH